MRYQRSILFEKLLKHYDGDLKGKKIAVGVWLSSLKQDMREAPALVLIDKLVGIRCVSEFTPCCNE